MQTPAAQEQACETETFANVEIAQLVARSLFASEYERVTTLCVSSLKLGGEIFVVTGGAGEGLGLGLGDGLGAGDGLGEGAGDGPGVGLGAGETDGLVAEGAFPSPLFVQLKKKRQQSPITYHLITLTYRYLRQQTLVFG